MHATISGRGQMVIPAKARKEAGLQSGDVVSVQTEGDGRIVLVRLQSPKTRRRAEAKIIRRKGKHPVGDIGRPITREEMKKALADFPWDICWTSMLWLPPFGRIILDHAKVDAWVEGKELATCPLSQLGFLRISTNAKALNADMEMARFLLDAFLRKHGSQFVADDFAPLESSARKSEQVTDFYLADLAASKGMKLATFDKGIPHAAVELIA
jgi:AbrB family looped-hinge helix DNA binding protein